MMLVGCSSDSGSVASSATAKASDVQGEATAAASAAESAASSAVGAASSAAESAAGEASEAAGSAASAAGVYTLAQVQAHNKSGDCWTAINGKVYDLTNWEDKHPGGAERIVSLCGTDGTAAFEGQHQGQGEPNETLTEYQIGTLAK